MAAATTTTTRPALPAFTFPALPAMTAPSSTSPSSQYSSSSSTTPETSSHTPAASCSMPRRHHRRTVALCKPAGSSVQRQIRQAHQESLPPVPSLPSDLSLLQKPVLARPSPRCQKQRPQPLQTSHLHHHQFAHQGTFFLDASRPTSIIHLQSSPALSVSDDGASSCPTLVSDHPLDSATTMASTAMTNPTTPPALEADTLPAECDEDDDDGEFWACIGPEACEVHRQTQKHTAVAEWVEACTVAQEHPAALQVVGESWMGPMH